MGLKKGLSVNFIILPFLWALLIKARTEFTGDCPVVSVEDAAQTGTTDWGCFQKIHGFIQKDVELTFHSDSNSTIRKVVLKCCSGTSYHCSVQELDVSMSQSQSVTFPLDDTALHCNASLLDNSQILDEEQLRIVSGIRLLPIIILALGVLVVTLLLAAFIACCRSFNGKHQQQSDNENHPVAREAAVSPTFVADDGGFGSYKLSSLRRDHPSWGDVPLPTSDP